MTETISNKGNLSQSCVFIQGLQEDSLDWLTEEIVLKLHNIDLFVELQGINQVDKTGIVKSATWEVKFL